MNIRLKQVGLLLALFIVGSCSNDMIETSNNSSLIEESYDEIDLNSLKSDFHLLWLEFLMKVKA